MNIFSSIHKAFKVNKLAIQISKPINSVADLLDNKSERSILELFDLILNKYDNLQPIIKKYEVDSDMLNDIYTKLSQTGAGQWVRGHYVSVSALVFPQTLEFCIINHSQENVDWSEISYKLILYFDKKEIGEIH